MHPIISDRVRTFLARTKLRNIIGGYILLTLVGAFALAFLYKGFDNNGISYLKWWQFAITQLLSAEPPNDINYELNGFQDVIFIFASILGVVFPALFFGAIVFKLFIHKNMLVFRKSVTLYYSYVSNKVIMSITIYNSSHLRIVNTDVRVYLRERTRDVHGKLNISNKLIKEAQPPVLSFHRPNHINVYLDKTDIITDGSNKYLLASIQGVSIDEDTEIRVLISGSIPELGSGMIEDYIYSLPRDLQWGYRENIPDDDPNPSNSASWKRFEEIIKPFEMPSENSDVSKVGLTSQTDLRQGNQ